MIDNWNRRSEDDSDLPAVDFESGDILMDTRRQPKGSVRVFKIFKVIFPQLNQSHWTKHKTIREAANRLWDEKGKEKIINALLTYEKHKENQFCPRILSPYDLELKWDALVDFKKKNNL